MSSFKEFFSSLREFVSSLDNFAYVPTFYIQRKPSYKSSIGGYVYLGYLIFFLGWILYLFSIFISEINKIKSIKQILTATVTRSFDINDIQFGLGLLDQDYKNLNWSILPGIEIVVKSIDNGIFKTFNLTYCKENLMYSNQDWSEKTKQDQILIKNLLNSYYLCSDDQFDAQISPKNWIYTNNQYFEIIVKLKNLSMLNSTMNLIQSIRPSIQLVWGSYAFMLDDYPHPINTFIDDSKTYIQNDKISKSEILLETIILNDNQVFSNNLSPYRSEINQNQNDGALFIVSQENKNDLNVQDRSISLLNDENLYFKSYEFHLDFQNMEITRFRNTFLVFITTLTSVPSLILFILMIIMEKVNVILAKNHLFKGLFSLHTFKNVANFRSQYIKKYIVRILLL